MKKIKILIIIVLLFIFAYDIKASEYESDFEYYYITYDFLNDEEYYVTYNFKPTECDPMECFSRNYYFLDENVNLNTLEHNLDDFSQYHSVIENRLDIQFKLNENKEYYIKYKGYLDNVFSIKAISNFRPNSLYDNSHNVSVYSFKLTLSNPETVGITEDKINNIGGLFFEKVGDAYIYLGGKKYEKYRYYDIQIWHKIILKSEIDRKYFIHDVVIPYSVIGFVLLAYIYVYMTTIYPAMKKEIKKDNNKEI